MSGKGILAVTGLSARQAGEPSEIDAAGRKLGVRLPGDYCTLLQESDGVEGFVGPDAYLMLWSPHELLELNVAYSVAEFAPGLVLMGTDGGDTGYGFVEGETTQYAQVPLVGLSREAAEYMGGTLLEMITRLRGGHPA